MPQTAVLPDRAARVLDMLKSVRGMSDHAVGAILGVSHAGANDRRKGKTRITLGDIEKLADGFGISPTVFLMEPAEAMRWIADNAPEVLGGAHVTRCTRAPWWAAGYDAEPEFRPTPYDMPLPIFALAAA